jgi:hypothetical protein
MQEIATCPQCFATRCRRAQGNLLSHFASTAKRHFLPAQAGERSETIIRPHPPNKKAAPSGNRLFVYM